MLYKFISKEEQIHQYSFSVRSYYYHGYHHGSDIMKNDPVLNITENTEKINLFILSLLIEDERCDMNRYKILNVVVYQQICL